MAGLALVIAVSLAVQWFRQSDRSEAGETVSIGLTNEELVALKRLVKPTPPPALSGITQLRISQVRDLEERLSALEKGLGPPGESLSAAASGDLRLIHKDVENLREQVTFQGQLIKEQRAESWDQLKWTMGLMVTLQLAILGFFWQLSRRDQRKTGS